MISKIGTQVIETQRLILRPYRREDAVDIYSNWANDDKVTEFLSWPTHQAVETSEAVLKLWLSRYSDPGYFHWGITVKEEGDHVIGDIALVDIDENIPSCEIGYCMGRAWWGKGIMTEALKAVMEYCKKIGFLRISARHNTANPASGRVMVKAGMSFEGILRKSDINNKGEAIDLAWYSYINEEKLI